MRKAFIIAATIAAGAIGFAGSRPPPEVFHDAAGNVTGFAHTDSSGTTHYTNRAGQTTGSARTDANGVTKFYDQAGRVTGTTRK